MGSRAPTRRHLTELQTVFSMGDGIDGTELHRGMGLHAFTPAAATAAASGALSAATGLFLPPAATPSQSGAL